MEVYRWITYLPQFTFSIVTIMSLLRRKYLFIRLELGQGAVFSFQRFRQGQKSFNMAVFVLCVAFSWLTFEIALMEGCSFHDYARPGSSSRLWHFFDNISIYFPVCRALHLWHFCNHCILVCNGGVCFTLYKLRDPCHKWDLCEKFLREQIGGCISVKEFCYMRLQGLSNDVIMQ